MSLISDALKKAQKEREKLQGEEQEAMASAGVQRSGINKRIYFYGAVTLVVIAALIIVTIMLNREKDSMMKALNVRNNVDNNAADKDRTDTPAKPPEVKPETQAPVEESKPTTKPDSSRALSVSEKQTSTAAMEEPVRKTSPKTVEKPRRFKQKPKKAQPAVKKKASKKIEAASPEVSEPQVLSVDDLVERGDNLMKQKQPLEAAEAYKAALKNKKSAGIYLKLYSAYKIAKNNVLARAYVEDGLVSFPGDYFLNKISAIMNIRARKYREAQKNAERALAQDKNDFALYTYLGLCYFHSQRYKEGLQQFQKSLDINSDAIENYYYMGLIFDNLKDYKNALQYYNVFYRLNPKEKNFKHKNWITQRMRTLQQYLNQQ